MANLRRRVKLYALSSESQWEDHGTGHISTIFMDHDKQGNSIMLQVRSEDDGQWKLYFLLKIYYSCL